MWRDQKIYYSKPKHIPVWEVLQSKKMRFLFAVVFLLWTAVGAQIVANKIFMRQGDIIGAFMNTNSGLIESTLEVTANYGNQYLTEEDKKSLISYLATGLGIQFDGTTQTYEATTRKELVFVKEASRAETTIKVVTVGKAELTDAFAQSEEKEDAITQYVMVSLIIAEDVNSDILAYQKKIDKLLTQLEIKEENINTTMQFSGSFAGNLLLETKNKMADRMIEALDGRVVLENREEDLYTIYGYTGLLNEYITVDGNKINIQVAMSYDEDNDITRIYLATPLISGDW